MLNKIYTIETIHKFLKNNKKPILLLMLHDYGPVHYGHYYDILFYKYIMKEFKKHNIRFKFKFAFDLNNEYNIHSRQYPNAKKVNIVNTYSKLLGFKVKDETNLLPKKREKVGTKDNRYTKNIDKDLKHIRKLFPGYKLFNVIGEEYRSSPQNFKVLRKNAILLEHTMIETLGVQRRFLHKNYLPKITLKKLDLEFRKILRTKSEKNTRMGNHLKM